MLLDDYEIRHVEECERSSILDYMMEYFFTEEYVISTYFEKIRPTVSNLEWQNIKDSFRQSHEHTAMNGPSFCAVHRETQKIVGFLLPVIEKNPKFIDYLETEDHFPPFKSKIVSNFIFSVLDPINSSANPFESHPEMKMVLDVGYLSVFPGHRGKGLATAILRYIVDWAKDHKIGLVHGAFSSLYSQRAAEKIGFKTCKLLGTASFRDLDGNPMYTEPNHTIFIMVYSP